MAKLAPDTDPPPDGEHDPPGRWVGSRPSAAYLRTVTASVVVLVLAAATAVWWVGLGGSRYRAAHEADEVVDSIQSAAADISDTLATVPDDCSLPSPFDSGGYALVLDGKVQCSAGVNPDRVEGIDLARGLSFPAGLAGQAVVVQPNGPFSAVAVLPAADLTPRRPSTASWVLYGSKHSDGNRPSEVPVVHQREMPPVTRSRPVAGGLVVAGAPLPSPLPSLAVVALGVLPLAMVARARRSVAVPLAELASPGVDVPGGRTQQACAEVATLSRRIDGYVAAQRSLVLAAEDAREEERRRLASELHDDAVQQLSAALLLMDVELADPVSLVQAQDSVRAAATGLRRLAAGLFPSSLARAGFTRAVDEALVDQGAAHPDIEFKLRSHDSRLVDAMVTGVVARLLFRNTVEAVRNAVDHGSPTRVVVAVGMSGTDAKVEVTDDGCGILPGTLERAEAAGHLGIPSMRTLVESVGGSLTITSEPWAATTVTLLVPVTPGAGTQR